MTAAAPKAKTTPAPKKRDIMEPVVFDQEKVYTCRKIVQVGQAQLLAVPFPCPKWQPPKAKFDDRTTHNQVSTGLNIHMTKFFYTLL